MFAVVALVLMGLGVAPMAQAANAGMTISAMGESCPCMHHDNAEQTSKTHDCCQKGSGQHCPDDMDCGGACASLCASPAFLTVTPALVARPARHDVYAPTGASFVPYQNTLNAPPPRA